MVICTKTADPICISYKCVLGSDGLKESCYIGSRSAHGKGQFWEKGVPIVKHRDFLPWAVQKQLNRSICHLGCRLGWAKGSTNSVVFSRWH